MYQNQPEGKRACYTLRIESRPEHLDKFADHLEEFITQASEVNFVSCDVAYDVPVPLTAVFVGSHDMRRKLTVYKGTRYFGLPTKRKKDGYCRVYDKKLELIERRSIQVTNNLTRIEMVYKPETRIALTDIVHHPPTQNRHYFASVIDDWDELPAKQAERIRQWQLGENTHNRYIREKIKESLASQSIDFNRSASEHWADMIATPIAAILGR